MPGLYLFFAVMVAALLGGCSSGGDTPPPPTDAGHHGDAAVSDLGFLPDGAPILDAGPPPSDGGPAIDGAPTDDGTTPTDAGPGTDAGTDAGPISMPCTAPGTCDPFTTTSTTCMATESCRPDTTGNTACQMLDTAPHALGEVCLGGNDCQSGTLCLDFGAGPHCEQMCPMGSIGFCSGENRCYGTLASAGPTCIQVCRPRPLPCNIYTQDCADPALACAFATDPETRAPYTGCRPNGTQTAGMPCGGTSGSCMRGLVCINEAGSTTCHQVCGGDDGGAPTCGTGEVCSGFARTWMVPYCR